MSTIKLGTPIYESDAGSINDASSYDWDLAFKNQTRVDLEGDSCPGMECTEVKCDCEGETDLGPDYFLKKAIDEMKDRSATYDSPAGERSIANTVSAFNLLTNSSMKSSDGWLFMCLLKLVRANSGGDLRLDSFVDGAAYLSLYGAEKVIESERNE